MPHDIYLFFRQDQGNETLTLRRRVEEICKERGWNFLARGVAFKNDYRGRPVLLIPRDVAIDIYAKSHRSRVASLVIGTDPKVPLHPDDTLVLRHEKYISLRRFVEYKAFWCRITDDPVNDAWVGSFTAWTHRVECDGEHDPRTVPFHIFNGDGAGLHDAATRDAFNLKYGHGALRHDDRNLPWRLNPNSFHSNEISQVAGYDLRPGYHWDVSTNGWRFSTPAGEWQVFRYINIYPNAKIRITTGAARKTA